jgi:hypothetical protein
MFVDTAKLHSGAAESYRANNPKLRLGSTSLAAGSNTE